MSTTKPKKAADRIDSLMDLASKALVATRYFDCERAALEALQMAHRAEDYERMARVILPLLEARRQKRLAAVDSGKLVRMIEPLEENEVPKAGCYLIEPPLVGADGRDLRERADAAGVPVFVVVREPLTRTGQWPVVMVGPITVRARVTPPVKDKPDTQWLLAASEALGDQAIVDVDPADDVYERVDQLLEYLLTVTDHEKLHQALEEACRAAMKQQAVAPRAALKKAAAEEEWGEEEEA